MVCQEVCAEFYRALVRMFKREKELTGARKTLLKNKDVRMSFNVLLSVSLTSRMLFVKGKEMKEIGGLEGTAKKRKRTLKVVNT